MLGDADYVEALRMKAEGATAREVAKHFGRSVPWVYKVWSDNKGLGLPSQTPLHIPEDYRHTRYDYVLPEKLAGLEEMVRILKESAARLPKNFRDCLVKCSGFWGPAMSLKDYGKLRGVTRQASHLQYQRALAHLRYAVRRHRDFSFLD